MHPSPSPSAWQRLTGKTLDFLLPPLCLSCDAPVGTNQALCSECWGKIHFIASPFCACCGAPFEVPVGDGMLCGNCLNEPPHFSAARAAMLYDDASKRLILGFKSSDRTHPSHGLAAWMSRAGDAFWTEADYILPVPLHRWRLLKRRYNQSALLAHAIGRITGKKILADALLRLRSTPIQGHRNRKQRQDNVHNAFALKRRYGDRLAGKTVVLVDDVLTTGATVNECSRILVKAGVKKVYILTAARVRSFV